MDNDIPTPAKGVYIYFDYIALGFVLCGTEELIRGAPWKRWAACFALGALFLFIGIMGSKIKITISKLLRAFGTSLPWVRASRLSAENTQLSDTLASTMTHAQSLEKRLAEAQQKLDDTIQKLSREHSTCLRLQAESSEDREELKQVKEQAAKIANPDIIFADAVQCVTGRIFGRDERPYSWWCIPIKSRDELRGCTIEVNVLGKLYKMLWITPLQDGPQKCIDLYPNAWVKIPLAARCEIDGCLTIDPLSQPGFRVARGLALITDSNLVLEKLPQPDVVDISYETLAPGNHVLEVSIRSAALATSTPFTTSYIIAVPEMGGGNSQFYLRHWDDFH